jgi:hypothetical protein
MAPGRDTYDTRVNGRLFVEQLDESPRDISVANQNQVEGQSVIHNP